MSEEEAAVPEEASVPGETKEQRFQRLATKRTQAALQKIALLSNLTSSNYAYTPDQADKIIFALRSAIHQLEAKFKRERTQGAGSLFSL